MAYLTLNGVDYLVSVGDARGRVLQFEHRRRGLSANLLVDTLAVKEEIAVTVTGQVSAGRFFTPGEARAFAAALAGGTVVLAGDAGDMVASARDIGWYDVQDYRIPGSPVVYRHVSCVLEEV